MSKKWKDYQIALNEYLRRDNVSSTFIQSTESTGSGAMSYDPGFDKGIVKNQSLIESFHELSVELDRYCAECERPSSNAEGIYYHLKK